MTYVKELATVGVEKAHGMRCFTEVCNISEDGINYKRKEKWVGDEGLIEC